jgi:hypothetical protein
MTNIIKGYKAMNDDMTCRGFKFEVGKTYKSETISMCSSGFHFCENVLDVYNYYPKSSNTVICEIEASGNIQKEGNKSATDTIKIVKKVTEKELLEIWINKNNSGNRNSGDWNSGDWNSGDWNSGNRNSGNRNSGYGNSGYGNSGYGNSGYGNSGDWNSGNRNSGNRNSGDWNSGDWNSGYGNSGYGNSGYGNSGDWNSGYGNSGDWNSGDWNSGNRNSGYFNTNTPLYLFNKPSSMEYTHEFEIKIRNLNVKPILQWISEASMTEEEKSNNPSHKTTGGFLRKTDRLDWRFLTEEDKKFIKELPNFDDNIFKEISGISLSDNVEVTVNGVTKTLSKEKAKELGLID